MQGSGRVLCKTCWYCFWHCLQPLLPLTLVVFLMGCCCWCCCCCISFCFSAAAAAAATILALVLLMLLAVAGGEGALSTLWPGLRPLRW